MADGVAMFRFNTNINEVESEISRGLQRINSSLSGGQRLSTPDLAQNTAGLGQMFDRLDADLKTRVARLQDSFTKGMNPKEIRDTFRRNVREGAGSISQIMADEIGLAPNVVATTAPIAEIAKANVRGYASTFRAALRAQAPHLFEEIKNLRFGDEIAKIAKAPLAIGQETSQVASYRNQLRAEGIIRRDHALGETSLAKAAQMGFSYPYMEELRGRTVKYVQNPITNALDTKFTPTDAGERLKQATRDAQSAEVTAHRIARETEASVARANREMGRLYGEAADLNKAFNESAAARRILDTGTPRTGPGYRVGQEYLRRQGVGAGQVTNPLDRRAIDEAITTRDERALDRLQASVTKTVGAFDKERTARSKSLDRLQTDIGKTVGAFDQQRAAQRITAEGIARTGPGFKVGEDYFRKLGVGAARVTNPLDRRAIDDAITTRDERALDRLQTAVSRTVTSFEQARAAARELADSERLVSRTMLHPEAGYTRNNSLRSVDFGEHYRATPTGVALETHPVRVYEADQHLTDINQQRANAARLSLNSDDVVKTGAYRVLGQEVYQLSQYGAKRVVDENRVREALEGQEAVMRRELALAERQLIAAKRSAVESAKASARQQGRSGGPLTGFFSRSVGANDQSLLNNIGSHVASAAQFTAGYGALFAIQNAIRDTIHEYLDYQDSLTDLQVATRHTGAVTQDWINTLGDVSRVTGENIGASMDVASRAVRAFGDPAGQSIDQLQRIGSAASNAAAKLALISNKPLQDATGDLIAVGSSFGFKPDQLDRVVDAVANAKRTLGGDPAQISQGLASIATSASTSGFDVNQAADLISLVQGRVDETGLAAATRLTRIFQTVSGTTGKGLGKELGVDTSQSVRKQLEDYAKIYNDAGTSKAVKDRITSQLGGTANLRELLAVLENGKQLQDAYGESAKNAGGATAEFNRKADSLAGTVKKITGDIRFIQTDLGRTDLGAPFAAALYTAEPLLHLLDRMLQAIDKFPNALKLSLGLVADLLVAGKAISVVSNARSAARARAGILGGGARAAEDESIAVATERRAAAEAAYLSVITEATAARAAAEGREVATITLGTGERAAAQTVGAGEAAAGGAAAGGKLGLFGGIARLGRFALNPWTLAAATVIGTGYVAEKGFESSDQQKRFAQIGAGTSDAYGRVNGTSASLGQAIADLRSAAGQVSQSDSNFMSATAQRSEFNSLRSQVKDLKVLQTRVQHAEAVNASAADTNVFGDGGVITTVSQLTNGLAALADAGQTARESMVLLIGVLEGHATPKEGQRYDPDPLSSKAAGQVYGALRDALPGTSVVLGPDRVAVDPTKPGVRRGKGGVPMERGTIDASRDDTYKILTDHNSQVAIADAYKRKARQLGIKKGDKLNSQQREELAHAAANALDLSSLVNPEERKKVRDAVFKALRASMAPGKTRRERLLNGSGSLSKDDVKSLINPSADGSWVGLAGAEQAAESSVPKTDDGTILAGVQRRYLNFLKNLRKRLGGKNLGILNDLISNAEDSFARTAVSNLEKLRAHDQGAAGLGKNAIRTIGRKYLGKEISKAGKDIGLLIEIMDRADKTSLDIIEAHLKRAAELAQHDAAMAVLNPSYFKPRPDGSTPKPPPLPGQSEAEKDYNRFHKARGESNPSNDNYGGDFAGGGGAVDSKKKKKGGSSSDNLTRWQREAMRQQALRNPQDTIGAARDDLNVAKANLAAIKNHKTQKYFDALKAVTEAQQGLANELASKAQAAFDLQAAQAGGGQMATAIAALRGARAQIATQTPGTVGYIQAQTQLASGGWQMRQAMAAKTEAVAQARASRIGGNLASSRASITGAAAQLRANARHTSEWFSALGSFYDAQQSMRDAVVQYRNNLDLLHGDSTNPVEQARDAVRAALRKLRSDRGHGKDLRAEDRVALQDARNSLQQSKFEQRMSDMQTNEELNRISFSKYMSYLDHEHERLSRIKHRTRQQQDQLNEVDKAMKDALNSMDGQFNLGDINTNGLVYQMRRFQAESRTFTATQAHNTGVVGPTATNQNITISINGADTAKVKSIISTYLNTPTMQRRTTARRKV